MVFFTIYRISGNGINYIGSTTNCELRTEWHVKSFYDTENKEHNKQLYTCIRGIGCTIEQLEFNILTTMSFKTREHARKHERYWVEVYDSIKNGQNCVLPWNTPNEKQQRRLRWDAIKKQRLLSN